MKKQINMAFPWDLWLEVQKVQKDEGMSNAGAIKFLIRKGLDTYNNPQGNGERNEAE